MCAKATDKAGADGVSGCGWCLQGSGVHWPQTGGSLDSFRGTSCPTVLEGVLRHQTARPPLWGRCAVWVSYEYRSFQLTIRFCYVNNVVVGAMHGKCEQPVQD